jgi:hypothetical protein
VCPSCGQKGDSVPDILRKVRCVQAGLSFILALVCA